MAKPAVELIETRQGCEMMETTKRFNVMLHGVKVEQLWWNMKGYVGNLPTPDGLSLYVPEAAWRASGARSQNSTVNLRQQQPKHKHSRGAICELNWTQTPLATDVRASKLEL